MLSIRNLPKSVLLAVVCTATTLASAQTTHHVAWSKIETGPWTLTPIYAGITGGTNEVVSFLAIADPATIIGDNLVAVWYQRGPAGWTTKSWETSNPWDAIKSVKQHFGIADDEDLRWGVPGGGSTTANAMQSKPYAAGVLAEDPLAELVTSSPDRDEIVSFLANIGYKVADLPVEKDDGCTTNAKLNGMAAAMAQTLVGDELTVVDRSMAAWIAAGTANCGVGAIAVEIIEYPPKPTSPWGPPTYTCNTIFDSEGLGWTQCMTWVETRTMSQQRTRARFNPAPPPTYQFCEQTQVGTQDRETTCCTAGITPATFPTPCPTIPPGTTPAIGKGCVGTLGTPVILPFAPAVPESWSPPCPF